MKRNQVVYLFILFLAISVVACKKGYSPGENIYPVDRKVKLQLWTNEDFSDNNSVISFSVFIKTSGKTIFDSAFAPMRIKDIPDSLHKIVVEKTISADINAELAAGFVYQIQNVGISWFLDTLKAGNTFKTINYAFR